MKQRDGALRVGGVGTGRIFQGAHLRVYPPLWRKAKMVGFFDIDASRSRQARDKYAAMLEEYATAHPESAAEVRANMGELTCHESLESLLKQVDLVDICTHSRGRMPTAMAAFRAGVSAMAEKPITRTWTEADRAARVLAECPGVHFQLNDDNFYEPKYRLMAALVARGAIGRVELVTLMRGSRLDATSVLKAQANALENGGGCLMDYGTHGLSGTLAILGPGFRPVKVDAVSIALLYPDRILEGDPYHMEVEDNARIRVMMENRQHGSWAEVFLEATWCGGHIGLAREKHSGQNNGYVQVIGTGGIIETDDTTHVYVKSWDGGVEEVPLREYPGETISMANEIEVFLDAVRSGSGTPTDIAFGCDLVATCGAAYLSAIRGTEVTLEEFKEWSRGFLGKLGDGPAADDAIVLELNRPYRQRKPA